MSTAVLPALTALIDTFTAAMAPQGVQVHDGPPMTNSQKEWVAVGFQPGSIDAVDMDYEWAQLGRRTQEETFQVYCYLQVWSGSTGMAARRARVLALRDLLAQSLRANPELNQTVRVCLMNSGRLTQEQDRQGARVGLAFTVACAQRIDS